MTFEKWLKSFDWPTIEDFAIPKVLRACWDAAQAAEREECAQVAEQDLTYQSCSCGFRVPAAIRARGEV